MLTEGNSVTGLPGLRALVQRRRLRSAFRCRSGRRLLAFALTYVLLYRTKFGRYTFAIGGNRHALMLSGSRARFYQLLVYVYAGVLTALASFIMTARLNCRPSRPSASASSSTRSPRSSWAARRSRRAAAASSARSIGALAVGVLRNGLNLMGVSTEWQVAIVGLVIIGAVGLDSIRGH